MELKIIGAVLLLSAAIFGIGLLVPESATQNTTQSSQGMPWQIEQSNGTVRVFNLTLGKSTLSEAESLLLGDSEISLFRSVEGKHVIEAYFDKVMLGGLMAKIVLVMDIPESELSAMYLRGLRISKLGSGSSKVSISTEDLHRTRRSVIASITYIPAINLKPDQLIARFGQPSNRIKESGSSGSSSSVIEHWLYPQVGLDVTLNEQGKAVLQYVKPDRFSQISAPLLPWKSNF